MVQDAATVSWPEGAKKPKTRELTSTGWAGASMGGLWGLLFGLLFFVPLLGVAIGAGIGALMGHFADYGIDKDFIDSVKAKVVPGTSALFLMSSNANTEKVAEEVQEVRTQGRADPVEPERRSGRRAPQDLQRRRVNRPNIATMTNAAGSGRVRLFPGVHRWIELRLYARSFSTWTACSSTARGSPPRRWIACSMSIGWQRNPEVHSKLLGRRLVEALAIVRDGYGIDEDVEAPDRAV